MIGEAVFSHNPDYLVIATVRYRLKNLYLRLGPGLEAIREDQSTHYEFIFRAGVGYEFHIRKYSLGLGIDLDGVRKHPAFVCGVSLGRGF